MKKLLILIILATILISSCSEDKTIIIKQKTTIYGEMWNYTSNATAWTFTIASAGVYYNLTGYTPGELNEVSFTSETQANGGSYLTTDVDGLYLANFGISAETTINNQLFAFGITKNHDIANSRQCYARRWISLQAAVGSIGISCILNLTAGDNVSVQVENEAGSSNLKVHATNLNIIRIGS